MLGYILALKSVVAIFVIFYDHLHQALQFVQFGAAAVPPWGTPPTHLHGHLHTCFFYPTSPKKVLNVQI